MTSGVPWRRPLPDRPSWTPKSKPACCRPVRWRQRAPAPAGWPDRTRGRGATAIRSRVIERRICKQLYVSEATVKTHINHIFTKTNSRDRSQAVWYRHRRGLAS